MEHRIAIISAASFSRPPHDPYRGNRRLGLERLIRALTIAGCAIAFTMPVPSHDGAWAQGTARAGHGKGHKHSGKQRSRVRVAANPALQAWWEDCNDDDAATSIQGCTAILQSGKETPANRAVALFNRGTSYLSISQFANAAQDFTESIAINPRDAETFNNRGEAWRAMGQKERADLDFRKARELDPDLPDP